MATRYWVGGSGVWDGSSTANWSAASGGASGASPPVAADTAIFDSLSGVGACTTASGAVCSTVTLSSATLGLVLGADLTMAGQFTLVTGSIDLQSFNLSCLSFFSNTSNTRTIAFGTGSITVRSNVGPWVVTPVTNLTITGTPTVNVTYSGSASVTISLGVPAESQALNFNFTSGTYSLSFLASNGNAAGSVDFTGFAGTWLATGTVTIFKSLTLSTGMTVTPSSSVMTFGATSGAHNITTNGKVMDFPVTFNGAGGTFQFTDALTQGSTRAFTITRGTVKLKAGTTNTVGAFTTGAGTAQRFLQSDTPGSRATITDPSGTNAATYLTVQDVGATGGATWAAPLSAGNVDGGNNTGWVFSAQSIGLSEGVGLSSGALGLYGGSLGIYGGRPGLVN